MHLFTVNNCGSVPIDVGGVTMLAPGSCFGWKVDVDAPVVLNADGEYSFTITYQQEQVAAVWGTRMVTTDEGEVEESFIVTPAKDLWQTDLLVAGFALSPGERSEVIKTTKPVTISVEGV